MRHKQKSVKCSSPTQDCPSADVWEGCKTTSMRQGNNGAPVRRSGIDHNLTVGGQLANTQPFGNGLGHEFITSMRGTMAHHRRVPSPSCVVTGQR